MHLQPEEFPGVEEHVSSFSDLSASKICWVSASHIVVGSCEWVRLVGSSFSTFSSVDCWKHLSQSIVVNIWMISYSSTQATCPHAPLVSYLSWHTDHACSWFGLWFHVAPTHFGFLHRQMSPLKHSFLQSLRPWPNYHCLPFSHTGRLPQRAHCSLSDYDPATAVSADSLMGTLQNKGKEWFKRQNGM